MPFDPRFSLDLFVSGTLVILAATLLMAGRKRPEGVILSFFLGLIALNFFAMGVGLPNGNLAWGRVAFLALALDPMYLLLFVTLYPYARRPRTVRLLLILTAIATAVSLAFVLFAPSRTMNVFVGEGAPGVGHLWIVTVLAVVYAAAWLLAIRAAAQAPTPLLAQRAAWLVVAVGVTVLPRLGLLPFDYGFRTWPRSLTTEPVVGFAMEILPEMLLVAVAIAAGGLVLRHSHRGSAPQHAARGLRIAAWMAGALVVTGLSLQAWQHFGDGFYLGGTATYGLRWIAFAAILVYGMLTYEIVEMRRAGDRVVPLMGAATGALAAGLATAAYLTEVGVDAAFTGVAAMGASLAAAVPAAIVARELGRAVVARADVSAPWERRLELYRAALETAWAEGTPSPADRQALERERRAFGVSYEEARIMEHMVARSQGNVSAFVTGEEPIPGVMLEEVLGTGSQGRVFKARRYTTGDPIVVKEIAPTSDSLQGRRRGFLDEIRALRELDHPHIVKLIDVYATGGRYALLLEYVDGDALSVRLARGRLAEEEVARILSQVMDAMETSHAHGVIHLDVKPSNILLTRKGDVKLADFGVATVTKPAMDVKRTATRGGGLNGLVGTLMYMAPEQVNGGRADPRTDLYAVGLVAYECLTGRPALDIGAHATLAALENVARPRIHLENVPEAWRSFLNRALAVQSADRFQTASEMRRALHDVSVAMEAAEAPVAIRQENVAPPRPITPEKPTRSGP